MGRHLLSEAWLPQPGSIGGYRLRLSIGRGGLSGRCLDPISSAHRTPGSVKPICLTTQAPGDVIARTNRRMAFSEELYRIYKLYITILNWPIAGFVLASLDPCSSSRVGFGCKRWFGGRGWLVFRTRSGLWMSMVDVDTRSILGSRTRSVETGYSGCGSTSPSGSAPTVLLLRHSLVIHFAARPGLMWLGLRERRPV